MLCICLETMFGRPHRVDRECFLSKANRHELKYPAAADVSFNDLVIDFVLVTPADMRVQWFAIGIISNEHSNSSIRHRIIRSLWRDLRTVCVVFKDQRLQAVVRV